MPTDDPTTTPNGSLPDAPPPTPLAASPATTSEATGATDESDDHAVVDATPTVSNAEEVRPTDATPVDATPTREQERAAEALGNGAGEASASAAKIDEAPADANAEKHGAASETVGGAPGEAVGDSPSARRRRRRRKRGGAGTPGTDDAAKVDGEADGATEASIAEGEAASAGETPAPGHAGPAKVRDDAKARARKPKPPQRPGREKPPFGIGDEVVGKVTKVMDEAIMVDVSGKALGIFDRKEIPESETPAEGENIIGKVGNDGARGGLVVLTKDLNRWQKTRVVVEAALTHKQPVQGLVTGVIKGGVEVDVEGLRGFAPASHVDLRLGADLHHLIGQRLPFEVVQFAKRGREFVLSRKPMLEEAAKAHRADALKALEIGKVVKGIVRSITQFGAFIDVGGIDGLVHASEASHTGAPLSEVFKVNEEVDVKILRVDDKGKIWLSRKAAEHDPWEGAAERYARGTRHKGKIVRLQTFGAFIELEPGIDGLMHIGDIPWPTRFHHPSEVMKVGDEIDVVVAQSDVTARKIGLHPPPKEGEAPQEPKAPPPPRLALHQAVQCVVEGHEPNGILVRIMGQTGRHAKAFIAAMATGTPKGTDLRKAFPVDKQIEAKIIELDPRKGGAKLSIRALAQDQERQSFRQYQSQVKQASKFGTFGDLLAKKGIGTK